ncbi:hypothetical protein [Streptomyces sp. MMS24-I29]|uniref:hypothetical protein n=1 Tax=Streptomyces sp. MMS24-I29 TaxID=3351480 RepID=UPI003C7CA98F
MLRFFTKTPCKSRYEVRIAHLVDYEAFDDLPLVLRTHAIDDLAQEYLVSTLSHLRRLGLKDTARVVAEGHDRITSVVRVTLQSDTAADNLTHTLRVHIRGHESVFVLSKSRRN